jgi:hypothetical protein
MQGGQVAIHFVRGGVVGSPQQSSPRDQVPTASGNAASYCKLCDCGRIYAGHPGLLKSIMHHGKQELYSLHLEALYREQLDNELAA